MGDYPFHQIDVLEYKIEIDIRESFEQLNTNLTGIVNIKCKIDTSVIEEIYLDAIALIVDSVFVDNEKVSFNLTDKYLIPLLKKQYTFGDILNVKIFYKRQSQTTPGYYFEHYTHNDIDEYLVCTASWQANTRYWLPCKDWPIDKALVEMKVKTPKNIVAVSNGELIKQIDEFDYTEYIWKDSHPMATYVISISAAKYVSVYRKIPRFSDPSDSIKITYYTFPEALSNMEEALEIVPEMINYYSSKFIEFPFDYMSFVAPGTIFGAMSNQTLIQFGNTFWNSSSYNSIMPHEIAHQWFGCYINSANWNLWMTEGLAFYTHLLYDDFVSNNTTYKSEIKSIAENYLLLSDSLSISDGQYGKLPVVLEMLRTTMGDSIYWKSFRNFLTTSGYGAATINEFIDAVNKTSGEIYNWFFEEWFYKPGYPKYNISWQTEKILNNYYAFIRIEQTQNTQEVFTMPVDITITTEMGNTTSKVMNNRRVQVFEFSLNSEPLDIIFDKDTLLYLKEVNYETVNFTPAYSYALEQNYPNPFNPTTSIEYRIAQTEFVSLKLFDILGNEIKTLVNEEKQPGIYGVEFINKNLSSGVYIYQIRAGNFVETKKMVLMK